ncbi:DUF1963 domain-containing protein [Leptolyngbya sp. FACHB-671]|uniref:YwqG family protein n=1 Tax=Leptolyngbya sp. FACHB-671 TaxID=2692812 RepID=UPI0016824833|nr:DUF1963 domain-containing protein [Leptolyngbya sp. FACHB-671]MBD2068578.1 DUF1963 domain-containing protein [Leptolyngbya sp. FACHB-671]
MDNFIPKALESKRDIFLATKMPFIHIEPFETNEFLSPWTSKYLGTPYLPKEAQYPYMTDGEPLAFLAQINFSEVPKLEGYPTSGILQFFISDDDLYGLEFTDPHDPSEQFRLQQQQNKFRVVYYPNVIEDLSLLTDSFDFLPEFEGLPVYKQCRLEFSLREELAGINDHRFAKLFGKNFNLLAEGEGREKIIDYQFMFSSGNKIGGYADFAQEDIRFLAPPEENWLLLLQISDAKNADIMWGDAGVGNFFIEEKALEARDFSRVLYNWDCG